MRQYWLLTKMMRRRLLICCALNFTYLFMVSWADLNPGSTDDAALFLAIPLIFSIIFAALGKFHFELYGVPFPVSHRQLALLPIAWMGAVWFAGMLGILGGMLPLFARYSFSDWVPLLAEIARIFPIQFLVFCLLDRSLRYFGFGALGFAYFPVMFSMNGSFLSEFAYFDEVVTLYHYGWPLCIGLGIFFVLEAPTHVRAMDFPTFTKPSIIQSMKRAPDMPVRSPGMKLAADLFMGLILAVVVVLFFSLAISLENPLALSTAEQMFYGVSVFGIGMGIRYAWHRAKANGFGGVMTFMHFLMKCSLVLLPLSSAMGAKRGDVALCKNCKQHKFVWAWECPHCAHVGEGALVGKWPWARNKTTGLNQAQGVSRLSYRVFVPVYVVLFMFVGGDLSFQGETLTISLTQEGLQSPADTLPGIMSYLASIKEPERWLSDDGEGVVDLPERFRIEVDRNPLDILIRCYWLPWEKGRPMAEAIRARIMEALPDAQIRNGDSAREKNYLRGPRNRFVMPNFLDNGIHLRALDVRGRSVAL